MNVDVCSTTQHGCFILRVRQCKSRCGEGKPCTGGNQRSCGKVDDDGTIRTKGSSVDMEASHQCGIEIGYRDLNIKGLGNRVVIGDRCGTGSDTVVGRDFLFRAHRTRQSVHGHSQVDRYSCCIGAVVDGVGTCFTVKCSPLVDAPLAIAIRSSPLPPKIDVLMEDGCRVTTSLLDPS